MYQIGRPLSDVELEAWDNYRAVLDKYHITHNVKAYDRISIHDHFPEIQEAYDKCLVAKTFALLRDGKQDEIE